MTDHFGGPGGVFVGMARRAWVRNLVLTRHGGADETEGMRMHEGARNSFRLDVRHVARDTLASRAAFPVVRVLFEGGGARAIGRQRAVAVQAYLIDWLSELRVVRRAVRVVAIEAGDAATIHDHFARNRSPAYDFCARCRPENA